MHESVAMRAGDTLVKGVEDLRSDLLQLHSGAVSQCTHRCVCRNLRYLAGLGFHNHHLVLFEPADAVGRLAETREARIATQNAALKVSRMINRRSNQALSANQTFSSQIAR